MNGHFLRIVPAPAAGGDEGGPNVVNGTRVFCGECELAGVYHVMIEGQLDGVWTAVIHVYPGPLPEFVTPAQIEVRGRSYLQEDELHPSLRGLVRYWWHALTKVGP
jgi:hypothetical protein